MGVIYTAYSPSSSYLIKCCNSAFPMCPALHVSCCFRIYAHILSGQGWQKPPSRPSSLQSLCPPSASVTLCSQNLKAALATPLPSLKPFQSAVVNDTPIGQICLADKLFSIQCWKHFSTVSNILKLGCFWHPLATLGLCSRHSNLMLGLSRGAPSLASRLSSYCLYHAPTSPVEANVSTVYH